MAAGISDHQQPTINLADDSLALFTKSIIRRRFGIVIGKYSDCLLEADAVIPDVFSCFV